MEPKQGLDAKPGDAYMIVGKVGAPDGTYEQEILIANGKYKTIEMYTLFFQDKNGNGQWFQISKELYFALLQNNIK